MDIPWHVKAKRRVQEKGLSYGEIGKALGLSPSGVGHYLNGRRSPKPGMLRNLAKDLDMSLSELIEDDPSFARNDDETQFLDLLRKIPEDQRGYAMKMLRGLAAEDPATEPVDTN